MKSVRVQLFVTLLAGVTAGGLFAYMGLPPTRDMVDAIGWGDVEQVQRNLMWCGDTFRRPPYAHVLLHYAAECGHEKVVRLFLIHGFEINAKDEDGIMGEPGETPLHGAVSGGHKQVVELLIAHGADVNAGKEDGWTPLDEALAMAEAGGGPQYKEIADILRKHGARESE